MIKNGNFIKNFKQSPSFTPSFSKRHRRTDTKKTMNVLHKATKILVELNLIDPELLILDATIFESNITYPNDVK